MEYPVTEGGKLVYRDVTDDIVKRIKKLGIDVLIAVGGDGTMKITQALFEKGVPVIGIPKTIDNDLGVTDVTFGFNSAVNSATDALDKLHTTAESHHRVLVLEVMGRDCGWIALEAGIAGGADVILIPEIPFDLGKICEHIRKRKAAGSRFSIVIVAEGAMQAGGKKIYEIEPGRKGQPGRLGGIGRWVAENIGLCTTLETRVAVLGHLQRGGTPTTHDRILATRFGVEAVNLIAEGGFGKMVCLKGRRIASAKIESAVKNYTEDYVICSECGKPDTRLVKDGRVLMLRCDACGGHRPVRKRRPRTEPVGSRIEEGQILEVDIEHLSKRGDGVTKVGKYTLYVANTKPGQKVRVRITRVSGSIAFTQKE